MRKGLSLLIALATVMVSSIPLVPESLACSGPSEMMHGMAMQHAPGVAAADKSAQHADNCRIECGCGCHASIDSLPHVLAPHSPDTAAVAFVAVSTRAALSAYSRPEARPLPVFSPPPQLV